MTYPRFYYVHPESACAFVDTRGPEVVLNGGDGMCSEVNRDEYLRACEAWEISPEPALPFENLL